MKKMYLFIIVFLLFLVPIPIFASERIEVTLNKCVDGDTAWFNLENKQIKARFLAIDTPESTNKIEEYGKEASKFTCDLLNNASHIQIEYDDNSDKQDKYNRELVWVFVDEKLLQELVVKEGLAEVKYIYGNYKYLDQVNLALKEAKKNKLNLWSDAEDNNSDYFIVGIGIIVIILLFCFNQSSRKKILKKIQKQAKKEFQKSLNNLK